MGKSRPQKLHRDRDDKPIPFPDSTRASQTGGDQDQPDTLLPTSVDQIYQTLDSMSRSIRDLARELNCLGFFDDDGDRPKAA